MLIIPPTPVPWWTRPLLWVSLFYWMLSSDTHSMWRLQDQDAPSLPLCTPLWTTYSFFQWLFFTVYLYCLRLQFPSQWKLNRVSTFSYNRVFLLHFTFTAPVSLHPVPSWRKSTPCIGVSRCAGRKLISRAQWSKANWTFCRTGNLLGFPLVAVWQFPLVEVRTI